MKKLVLSLFLCFVLIFVTNIRLYASNDLSKKNNSSNKTFWEKYKNVIIITTAIVVVAGGITIYSGISTECPYCNKWWQQNIVDKTILNSKSFWVKNKNSIPKHKVKKTIRYNYKCSNCGKSWHKDKVVTSKCGEVKLISSEILSSSIVYKNEIQKDDVLSDTGAVIGHIKRKIRVPKKQNKVRKIYKCQGCGAITDIIKYEIEK